MTKAPLARLILNLNFGSQSTKFNTVKWMALTSIHPFVQDRNLDIIPGPFLPSPPTFKPQVPSCLPTSVFVKTFSWQRRVNDLCKSLDLIGSLSAPKYFKRSFATRTNNSHHLNAYYMPSTLLDTFNTTFNLSSPLLFPYFSRWKQKVQWG